MERRPKRARLFLENDDDIDGELDNDSDTSSLFSSNGGSVYNPSSDSDEDTEEEMSEGEINYNEVLDVSVGLNPDSPLVNNPNIEFVPDVDEIDNDRPNQDIFNDPNVIFVVNSIHNNVQNEENVWKNTSNLPTIHNFVGQEQIHIDCTNPIEVFNNLFDDDLVSKICSWVNKRAETVRGNPLPRYSNLNKWEPVTTDELKKFLGLCILMGNLNFPSIQHFWSTSPLYEHPIFSRTMARNRFQSILQCLCFYDVDIDSTNNRLHKIDNVLNHLLNNFTKVYSPGKNLSLDEAMILWRGRLSFRQYIKNKKNKYGIKLYELCTADGFILNILIYTGKGTIVNTGKGHTYEVVMRLMQQYLSKGHALYLDNFYNSVVLAEDLMEKQTNMCGTLQQNREGNPIEVVRQKLKKGEHISRQKGDITVMKWRDKRDVLVISTTNGPTMENVRNKRGDNVSKPSMVVSYNKSMSGIDRSDQMLSYYSTPRKSLRWYVKVFFHLMDASLWNSMYIYSKLCPESKMTYLQFRDAIIENFLNVQPTPRAGAMPTKQVRPQHLPVKLDKRVRCHNCRKSEMKRKTTFYVCSICKDKDDKSFGLCMPDCFQTWHKM